MNVNIPSNYLKYNNLQQKQVHIFDMNHENDQHDDWYRVISS